MKFRSKICKSIFIFDKTSFSCLVAWVSSAKSSQRQFQNLFLFSSPDLCVSGAKDHGQSGLDGQLCQVGLHGMIELENMWKFSGRRVVINLPVHDGATGREDTSSSSSCQPSCPPSRNLGKQESLFRTIECNFCTDSPHTIVSPSLLDTYGKDLSPEFADLKKVN